MLKIIDLMTVMVALAPGVPARNCERGYLYCGSHLRSIAYQSGNYDRQILEAMAEKNYTNPTNWEMNNSLFYCLGYGDGDVDMVKLCQEYCDLTDQSFTRNNDICDEDQYLDDDRNRRDGMPRQGF
ncbi:hypothetical protein V8F06_009903 [Rhypophila decipiens]